MMTAKRQDRNRRDFLRTALGGTATIVAAGNGFHVDAMPEPPSTGHVKFGVRGPFDAKHDTIRKRALLLQKLGFDGLELGHEFIELSVDQILSELDGTGIAISAIVGSIKLLDLDPAVRAQAVETDRLRLEMAKALGAVGVIEVPVFGPNKFQDLSPVMTPLQIKDRLLTEGFKQLVPDLARTGIKILLEPLTKKETHYMNLQGHGARIIEAVGAPGVSLLSDYYHMQLEEADIGATLGTYGKYTAYVHLADGEKRTEPGSLPFNYKPGFHSLKKWGYSSWLTIESGATDNAEAALERALAYLKRQWAEA